MASACVSVRLSKGLSPVHKSRRPGRMVESSTHLRHPELGRRRAAPRASAGLDNLDALDDLLPSRVTALAYNSTRDLSNDETYVLVGSPVALARPRALNLSDRVTMGGQHSSVHLEQ